MELTRGFLPTTDPLTHFPQGNEFCMLDELGHDLPSLLEDKHFRLFAQNLKIPHPNFTKLEELRLYYVRLGFLASGYIHQLGQEPVTTLPRNIAVPLNEAAKLLNRPPILSYDGYALYNWKRFDKNGPIALGNIDTIQNFVHMYDEHWFILIHVEIEALAGQMLLAIDQFQPASVNQTLQKILDSVQQQVKVLRRIPEKMDPALYFKTFRKYIRFFEHVTYESIHESPINFRGETGAQSSIMPTLVAFLKIPHQPSELMNHLEDMKNYMPAEHRAWLEKVKAIPSIRDLAEKDLWNDVLEAVAEFRQVHYGWATQYIQTWEKDPRGTGGTPYMKWLKQLIDETRGYKKT